MYKYIYEYWNWSITSIMENVLKKYLNIDTFKEGIYRHKNQIIQLSQEICPHDNEMSRDDILHNCFIQQNGKNIMNNRDTNYDVNSHTFD